MTRHLSAQLVAQLIGIKTATLAKWRREGRGPAGSFHVSTTLVVYPADEVERYLREQQHTGSGR
jgi:transposase-like protein